MISDHNLPPKPQFTPVALILLLKMTSFINDNILVLIANTVGFTGRGSKKKYFRNIRLSKSLIFSSTFPK